MRRPQARPTVFRTAGRLARGQLEEVLGQALAARWFRPREFRRRSHRVASSARRRWIQARRRWALRSISSTTTLLEKIACGLRPTSIQGTAGPRRRRDYLDLQVNGFRMAAEDRAQFNQLPSRHNCAGRGPGKVADAEPARPDGIGRRWPRCFPAAMESVPDAEPEL